VHAGGAQRFTAGRGITHSEMPDGHAAGIQLWINLPQRLKHIDAEYQQVEDDAVPSESADGVRLLHIVGEHGAIRLHTDVEYLDVTISPGSRMQRDIGEGWRGIIYIVEGMVEVGGFAVEAAQALLIENEAALELTSQNGTRLMWCFGAPHHEPIHQHGPYVD